MDSLLPTHFFPLFFLVLALPIALGLPALAATGVHAHAAPSAVDYDVVV